MRFEFHPEALEEYDAAAAYYAERVNGLDLRFIEAVEEAVAKIRATPLRGRILDGEVRRCLTRVFPYAVLYTIEPDYILIIAVMHSRREPGYWKHRLKGEA